MRHPIHELHDTGGLKRRESEQEQETGDQHRPHEEGQAHPGHAAGAEVDDGGDEIHRAKQRRGDKQHQAEQPLGLAGQPLVDDLAVGESCERRVVRPAGFCSTGLHEERGAHDYSAEKIDPIANHVQLREGHVHRPDLEGRDVVSESSEAERHDAEEDHDGAVHGTEHVVGLACHFPVLQPAGFPGIVENEAHPLRKRLVGICDAPPHHHHQIEPESKEQHGGDAVLHSDHLVVGGENVFPDPADIVMVIAVVVVRMVVTRMGCCVGAHRC